MRAWIDIAGKLMEGLDDLPTYDPTPEQERELTRQARERSAAEDPKAHLEWLGQRVQKAKDAATAGISGPHFVDLLTKVGEAQAEYDAFKRSLGGKAPKSRARPEQVKTGTPAAFLKQVIQAGREMLGADPEDFDPDVVREWVASHRALFRRGKVRVYRTMQVSPEWIAGLKPETSVGAHWTWDLDTDNFSGFDMNVADNTKPIITIEADIDTRDMNFPLSVAYNVLFDHEKEIHLQPYATPVVVSIRPYDFNTQRVGSDNLRPDLVGQTLRP